MKNTFHRIIPIIHKTMKMIVNRSYEGTRKLQKDNDLYYTYFAISGNNRGVWIW